MIPDLNKAFPLKYSWNPRREVEVLETVGDCCHSLEACHRTCVPQHACVHSFGKYHGCVVAAGDSVKTKTCVYLGLYILCLRRWGECVSSKILWKKIIYSSFNCTSRSWASGTWCPGDPVPASYSRQHGAAQGCLPASGPRSLVVGIAGCFKA